ncbi:MAG: hypothetical protein HY842_01105 [Bacteroidetes bacterium]|nr:hypothetical protein [Bacteroidota bacterium]
MKNSLLFLVFPVLVILATMGGGCYYDNNTYLHPDIACDTTAVMSFANDIMPILNNTCGTNDSCHGSNNTSGIALNNYDGVKQMIDNGKLLSAVIWDGNASQMPQGNLEQIDKCSQAKIRRWIAEGAPDN